MKLGKQIAEFIQTTKFGDFPDDVIETAKLCILDSIGVSLYGTQFKPSQIMLSYAKDVSGKKESTVLGSRLKVPAGLSALVNGVSAHVADYDDALTVMQAHPSAVLMPTALALAEASNTSGKALLSAFIMGVEIGGKLGKAMQWTHYNAGWHGTGTIGTIAAAAAAANLLHLNVGQTTNAIGIAASGSAGLRENFGTMTKSYHAGLAAQNGIVAAQLALKGFTASETILEGPSGFFNTFSGSGHLTSLPADLGPPWSLNGIIYKQYPSCAGTHAAVDAILDLKHEVGFKLGEIEEIECKVRPVISSVLIHPDPQNELEAKFSMQFCVSAALITGQLGIAQFDTETIQEPKVQAMIKRIRMIPDEGLEKLAVDRNVLAPIRLTLKLSTGKEYVREMIEARGGPSNPLDRQELGLKFLECSTHLLPLDQSKAALEILNRIEAVEKVSEITEMLTPIK